MSPHRSKTRHTSPYPILTKKIYLNIKAQLKLTVFVFIPIQKKTTVNMKMKNLSRNFIRKKKAKI